MTVVLHYHGGPQDGNRRRIPEPKVGQPVVREVPGGVYASEQPWDGLERQVALRFCYSDTGDLPRVATDHTQPKS